MTARQNVLCAMVITWVLVVLLVITGFKIFFPPRIEVTSLASTQKSLIVRDDSIWHVNCNDKVRSDRHVGLLVIDESAMSCEVNVVLVPVYVQSMSGAADLYSSSTACTVAAGGAELTSVRVQSAGVDMLKIVLRSVPKGTNVIFKCGDNEQKK